MQATVAPKPINRPQVKRMTQKELRETQASFDFDSTSIFQPNNRFSNRTQSQVIPEPMVPWRPTEGNEQNSKNLDNNKCNFHRGWFYLFGVVFCFMLIVAIVGIVLGIVLPATSTSTSDVHVNPKMRFLQDETVSPMTCSNENRGLFAFLNETFLPTGWTRHSYNYSATKINPQLVFGFETNGNYTFYLDMISVVNNQMSSIQLLANLDSKNLTLNTTHWIPTCQTACSIDLISTPECFQGTGHCFMINCSVANNSSIVFLSQYFESIIGNVYTISFMIHHRGYSSNGKSSVYIDII